MPFAKAVFKQIGAEVRSIDEKTRTISHKITVEVRDRMGDIVRIGGIDTTAFQKKPGVLYGHDYRSMNPIPVIGENVGFGIREKSLWADTHFLDPKEVSSKLGDLVNDCWILNKKKLLGWSIGFIPGETKDIVGENGQVVGKEYVTSELLEYSNVIIPANQEAVNDAISRGLVSKSLMNFEGRRSGPAPLGEVYFYKWVEESEVFGDRVRAALSMIDLCQRKLKIPAVNLAWYQLCDPRDLGAMVLGPRPTKAFVELAAESKICLRADMTPVDTQLAAAHELHHHWLENQPADRFASLDADDRENSANAFAFMMWQELRDKHAQGWRSSYL